MTSIFKRTLGGGRFELEQRILRFSRYNLEPFQPLGKQREGKRRTTVAPPALLKVGGPGVRRVVKKVLETD